MLLIRIVNILSLVQTLHKLVGMQESADNVSPDSTSPSKDALLEEACRKYDEATRLCPTLHDVCKDILCCDVLDGGGNNFT